MKNFNLEHMKKQGKVDIDKSVGIVIGVLITVMLVGKLAPEMFSSITGMEKVYNETTDECIENCNTPDFVPVVLVIVIGAGLLYLIWRTIQKGK